MMDEKEFDRTLKLGLGRVILHLQKYPAAPHRESILHACLHSLAYDTQIEGNRAEYMFDIIELTGEAEFYRQHILAALADSGDDWDASQLFDLARRFAQRGDAAARQAMYDKFLANCRRGDDTGAEQLIFLDGIPGFLFAAEQIGKMLLDTDSSWKYSYLLDLLKDMSGEDARLAVEQVGADNAQVKAYMDSIAEVQAKREKWGDTRLSPASTTYDQLKQLIIENGEWPNISTTRWGELATDTDLAQAASDLLLETDPRRLRGYLRIFWRRMYPLDVEPLIELARHQEMKIAAPAMRTLQIIPHPMIRTFALDLIATLSDRIGWAPELLVKNYQEGDHLILERLMTVPLIEDNYQQLGRGIMDFCEAHPNPESEERLMLMLYEHDPCSHCREGIVERLLAIGRLPTWMAEECRYDVNLDIREKFMP
jgi:hypothetical protein